MKQFHYVQTKREEVDQIPSRLVWLIRLIMKWYTRLNVWVFKTSKGRLMKHFPGGYPICIVGMQGRRSNKRREVALIHLPMGEKKLIVASQGGLDKHPGWYFNIASYADIDIMVAGSKAYFKATELDETQKAEVWPHLLSLYPDFDEYQARTDRAIPVFLCEPVLH